VDRATPVRASLQFRLLAGTLAWIVVTLVVAGWGLTGLFTRHVSAQFDAELATHLDQLAAHLRVDAAGGVSLSAPLSDPRLGRPYSGLYWQVDAMPAGDAAAVRGLLRSRSLWDVALAVPADALADGEVHAHRIDGPDGATLRMLERMVLPAARPERPLRLIVAADERWLRAAVSRFTGMLVLALGVLALGLMSAVVVQVVIGLRPLRRLAGALAAVRSGTAQSIAGRFPSEIQPLVDDFNTVLARNTEVVTRARTQAGNLAHAVKTPLAVLANAAAGDDSALAHLVGEQVAAAQRQVDHHLARARAAAAVRLPGVRTPVRPVLEGLVRVMRRVHAGRELSVELEAPPDDVVFRGDEQDLHELLGNVLDNACKWAAKRVRVVLARDGARLTVTVDDDGPGLAAVEREAVFGRGVRGDERVPGSGLGLAIVRDLARLYGGEVRLGDASLGGLRVSLVLPAAPADSR
jgi:signal transduction histidine kinase